MSIRRYRTPFDTLKRLEEQMLSIFDEDEERRPLVTTRTPQIDLRETDENYILEADIPGMKKEDIEITATSDGIEFKAERSEEKEEEEEGRLIYRERRARQYQRRINFSTPIDPNKAMSEYDDGVLKLTLPKSEESRSVRLRIE